MPSQSSMIDQGVAPQPGGVLLGNVAFIPPGFEGLYKEPFSYNVVFNTIGANSVSTSTTQINNDSFFVCVSCCATIWDATGNTTNTDPKVAPMYARILDSSSGKYKMDQATPIAALFGTAEQPALYLYRANVFMPGGQIQVELTNRMTSAQLVYLTFNGFKVYKVPDQLTA